MAASKKILTPSTPVSGKETVYIDVDDEITNIIDKVKSSDKKIVALVLPKRASVLQSVVNMKLLKKAAQNGKKNVVLITSETALLPLAGAAGLHVAKSLQSKPVIPPPPHHPDDTETETISGVEDDSAVDATATVGALAAAAASRDDETDTIELDNMTIDEPAAAGAAVAKKKKHLKVPNFERFRLGFFLAGLALLLLILGWYFAFVVMPKAAITVKTDTTSVVSSFDFTVSSAVTELDAGDQKIPGTLKELKKTDTEKVPATGEKDLGTKASGEVTLAVPCTSGNGTVVPEGTAVSTGGLNFITQDDATLNQYSPSPCRFYAVVDVLAGQNGDQYNVGSGKTFSVAGTSTVTGSNSEGFSGGTSKKVKVVSQKDIDDAATAIKARTDSQAGDELQAQFDTESLYALKETLKSTEPKITPTPALDAETQEVTVTFEISYTMLGIKRDDLVAVIRNDIEEEVDLEKQAITDDGIDAAVIRINNQASPSEAFLNFRTSVTAGPEIDEEAIKEAVRGKKRGEVENYIEGLPGVQEVVVEYSPFWVYTTPKSAKKITITVEKTGEQPADQTNNDESE